MGQYTWLMFALLGAVLAATVQVMTKRALDKLDVAVAVTVQSVVMLVTLLSVTTITQRWSALGGSPKWALGLVGLSGVAAGLAWFCGYKALQMTEISRATTVDRLSLPIAVMMGVVFLKDRPSALNWVGVTCMVVGAILVSRPSAG
ncbi:MAG TPA: EamA family transporter [Tepidisphaeraceae bacterium]|jgi:transporter family protein|nr:EamA family transporter [Tepidisphaeraceae bacterium]